MLVCNFEPLHDQFALLLGAAKHIGAGEPLTIEEQSMLDKFAMEKASPDTAEELAYQEAELRAFYAAQGVVWRP